MLLGQARGKVGDIVFSRTNGQQVVRARSAQVKNTKTTAQTLQRIVMNTVSQAYSFMLPICDHSFEGVKVGQDTMSAFMKRNLNLIRRRIVQAREQNGSLAGIYSFTPVGSKVFALNNYIMSEGTLPRISITGLVTQDVPAQGAQLSINGASASMTYADFLNNYGLNRGDQVTFIQVSKNTEGNYIFQYARVIMDPIDAEGVPSPLTTPLISENAINNPSDRNEGLFSTLSAADGVLTFNLGGGTPVGACVIVSRQDASGVWLRSTATLTIPANLVEFNQIALLDAIDMYYSGGIDLQSDWYLNNSTTNSSAPAATPSYAPQLQSFSVAGYSLLGQSSTQNINPNASAAIAIGINYFDASQNIKIIGSSRDLAVGDMYDSQAGEIVVPCNSGSVNTTVNLSTVGSYRFYFVYGGLVKRVLGQIVVEEIQDAAITSATFNGTNLVSNQTITSIYSGTQGTLNVVTINAEHLSDPKICIIKSNTQPTVGSAVSNPAFSQAIVNNAVTATYSFDEGMNYLALVDGTRIVSVVSAMNVTRPGEDSTPGEGD